MTLQLPEGALLRREHDPIDQSSEDRTTNTSRIIRRDAGELSAHPLTGSTARTGRVVAWTEIDLDTPSATNVCASNSLDRRAAQALQPHPEHPIGLFSAPVNCDTTTIVEPSSPQFVEEREKWLTSPTSQGVTSQPEQQQTVLGESLILGNAAPAPTAAGPSTTAGDHEDDLMAQTQMSGHELLPAYLSSGSIVISSRIDSPVRLDEDRNSCLDSSVRSRHESLPAQSRSSSREVASFQSPNSLDIISASSEKRRMRKNASHSTSSLPRAAVSLREPNALRQDIPDSISSTFRLPLNPFDDALIYPNNSSNYIDAARTRAPLATERNHNLGRIGLQPSECFDAAKARVEQTLPRDCVVQRGGMTARVMPKGRPANSGFQGLSPDWYKNFLTCNDASSVGHDRIRKSDQHSVPVNEKDLHLKVQPDGLPFRDRHLTWWQALLKGHPVHIVNILRGCILHPLVITLLFSALLGSDWRHSDLSYSGGTETRSRTLLSLSKIERMSETRDPSLPAAAIVRELPMKYNAVHKAHPDPAKKEAFCDSAQQLDMSREYLRSIDFENIFQQSEPVPDRQARLALYHVLHGPTFRDVDCQQLKVFHSGMPELRCIFS